MAHNFVSIVAAAVALTYVSSAFAEETAAAAPPSTQPATESAPKGVSVTLNADDSRAAIERRVGTTSYAGLPLADASFGSIAQWQQACVAPCQLQLDSRYSYRVAGDGLVPSDSFTLPQDRDRLKLDAKMGSSYGRLGGIGLAVLGAGGVFVGAAAVVLTPIFASQDVGSGTFRTGLLAGGVSVLSLGAIAVGAGIFLWATNGTTIHPANEGVAKSKLHFGATGLTF
ncbi:MAG: hypothetical protein ACRELY_09800 [Polyangiaceae bacterium]